MVVNSICLLFVLDFFVVNVSFVWVCLGLVFGILWFSYDYCVVNLILGLSFIFLVLYFILEGKILLKYCEGVRMFSIKYFISLCLVVWFVVKVWSVWCGSRGLRFCILNGIVGCECLCFNSFFLYEISDMIG